MNDIEIKLNPQQIDLIRDLLGSIPREIPKIMRSAINTTATQARTQIVNKLSAQVVLKKDELRKAIILNRADLWRWQAKIDVHGKRIPLLSFGARQIAFGVTYRISDMLGAKLARHAFIKTMNTSKGVFMRYQKAHAVQTSKFSRFLDTHWRHRRIRYWKADRSKKALINDMIAQSGGKGKANEFTGSEGELVPRFPVRFLKGPSPGALLERSPGLAELVTRDTEINLERNIDAQIVRVLQRLQIKAEAV